MELEPDFEPRWFWPVSAIFSGSSGTGKTVRTLQWIRNIDSVFCDAPPNLKVYYIFATDQPIFNDYRSYVRFFPSLDYPELMPDAIAQNRDILYIFDDTVGDVDQELLRKLFTVYVHHLNVSVILLHHHLTSRKLKYGPELSANCHVFIFTYSPSNQSSLRLFSQRYFGSLWRQFMAAVEDCLVGNGAASRFSYITINFSPKTHSKYRVSTYLVPHEEGPRLFYVLNE